MKSPMLATAFVVPFLLCGPISSLGSNKAPATTGDIPPKVRVIDMGGEILVCSVPAFRKHAIPNGQASAVAGALNAIYKNSPTIRIAAVGDNAILIFAFPNIQDEIATQLAGFRYNAPSDTDLNSGPRR